MSVKFQDFKCLTVNSILNNNSKDFNLILPLIN